MPVNPSPLGGVESIVEVYRAITHQFSGPGSSPQAKNLWFKPKALSEVEEPPVIVPNFNQSGTEYRVKLLVIASLWKL